MNRGIMDLWAIWADTHGIHEMFWAPDLFIEYIKNPRSLWWNFQEHWFSPQSECIDYLDGYCVGTYDTPSRFMWGVYKVQSWVDPRYLWWRWKGLIP